MRADLSSRASFIRKVHIRPEVFAHDGINRHLASLTEKTENRSWRSRSDPLEQGDSPLALLKRILLKQAMKIGT